MNASVKPQQWPTWQEARKAKQLPHEFCEILKRNAEDIQAQKLEYLPRTFAEVLKGKKREVAHSAGGAEATMMTPAKDEDISDGNDSNDESTVSTVESLGSQDSKAATQGKKKRNDERILKRK
jgi:hypothetical protein